MYIHPAKPFDSLKFGMAQLDKRLQKLVDAQIAKTLAQKGEKKAEEEKAALRRIVNSYFPAYKLSSDRIVSNSDIVWLTDRNSKTHSLVVILEYLPYTSSCIRKLEKSLKKLSENRTLRNNTDDFFFQNYTKNC